jgi:hypothetical protein
LRKEGGTYVFDVEFEEGGMRMRTWMRLVVRLSAGGDELKNPTPGGRRESCKAERYKEGE